MKLVRSLAATAAAFAAFAAPIPAMAHGTQTKGEAVKQAFQYEIANVPGKSLTALIVNYAPGGKTQPHRHGSAFVTAYVLSGAIRSQLDDGEVRVYHAGESWTERPGQHHTVSENASDTEPARLLAVFVADSSDKNLVILDK